MGSKTALPEKSLRTRKAALFSGLARLHQIGSVDSSLPIQPKRIATLNRLKKLREGRRSDLLPLLAQGASGVEACEVGRSPEALRLKLMHPSGRPQAPHPLLQLRRGLQDTAYLAEYLNLTTRPPPLAYPLPFGRGLASNGKIKSEKLIRNTNHIRYQNPRTLQLEYTQWHDVICMFFEGVYVF